ncbi:hypothetical protein KM043_008396 [Ampulex compressa]|nr:hypothetical protein KM043_008396 [Ampulex compressa]
MSNPNGTTNRNEITRIPRISAAIRSTCWFRRLLDRSKSDVHKEQAAVGSRRNRLGVNVWLYSKENRNHGITGRAEQVRNQKRNGTRLAISYVSRTKFYIVDKASHRPSDWASPYHTVVCTSENSDPAQKKNGLEDFFTQKWDNGNRRFFHGHGLFLSRFQLSIKEYIHDNAAHQSKIQPVKQVRGKKKCERSSKINQRKIYSF